MKFISVKDLKPTFHERLLAKYSASEQQLNAAEDELEDAQRNLQTSIDDKEKALIRVRIQKAKRKIEELKKQAHVG